MKKEFASNLKKVITLGLITLILSGCATLGQPLKLEYKQSIKNIAVVSVMGDIFEGVKIGTTVFNNERFEEDFSGFKMDKRIEGVTVQYLQRPFGFNALVRPDLREEFRGAFGYQSKPKQSLERLKPTLQHLKAEGIDAVFIISQERTSFESTPVFVHGYGIAVRTFLMIWYAKAYFISKFTLVDTSTQEIVFDRIWWWWKDIKFSKWQKSFSELSTTEQEATKSFLGEVLDSGIPKFLEKFNF